MTDQGQNQAYLQWYFRMHEPQASWGKSEILPQDIVREQAPHPSGDVERWLGKLLGKPDRGAAGHLPGMGVNPWAFNGLAAGGDFPA